MSDAQGLAVEELRKQHRVIEALLRQRVSNGTSTWDEEQALASVDAAWVWIESEEIASAKPARR